MPFMVNHFSRGCDSNTLNRRKVRLNIGGLMKLPNKDRVLGFFVCDERGATAVEYALIATLICVVIVAALTVFSGNMGNMFNTVSTAFGNA